MDAPLHEARTTIFARLDGQRQWIAYALRTQVDEDLSVAIPLPVRAGTRADEILLSSLHDYPEFFSLLQNPFRRDKVDRPPTRGPGGVEHEPLEVVVLGDYAASVAPNLSSLERLQPALALGRSALERVPAYATYAFVILRLKPPPRVELDVDRWRKPVEHHAVLISFPTSSPDKLFFPTLVAYNGNLPDSVRYDHQLFCQTHADRQPEAGWERSLRPLGRYVAQAIVPAVDSTRHVYRRSVRANYPNQDLHLAEPVAY